jgi:hypothetical protein
LHGTRGGTIATFVIHHRGIICYGYLLPPHIEMTEVRVTIFLRSGIGACHCHAGKCGKGDGSSKSVFVIHGSETFNTKGA